VVTVSIDGAIPGVEATLDRNTLKAGEKAVLTVRRGENARSGSINIHVRPTDELIPIQVTIQ
jgi:hypothetical protein